MAKKLPPVHPSEILWEEFLVSLKLTPDAVAAALKVPRTRIERIARKEKPVTADTALRLGKFFKTGAAFWMNMQARFDLERPKTSSRRRSGRSVLRGGLTVFALLYGNKQWALPISG
jgi:addiction module HigA family antidote